MGILILTQQRARERDGERERLCQTWAHKSKMKQSDNKADKGAMTEDGARGSKRHKVTFSEEEKCKQALASITTLHGLLRDLIVEMRTFEYPLPLHEVKVHEHEVKDEAGLTNLLMKEKDKISIKIALQMDHIFRINQTIGSDMERGMPREVLDRVLYDLQGRMTKLKGLYERYTANRATMMNLNLEWLSEDDYTLAYDSIEAVSPFVHDKIDVCLSPAATLSILEKGKISSQFTEGEKKELREDFRRISRLEDLMGCIVNVAINIDEEINCLVERYLKPGRTLSEEDKKTVQDVRKMLREMTDIEDSLLQGMSVNEAATKGQILGLTTYFCMDQVNLWLHRKIFFQTKVFDKCNKELFLCPLQSAGGLLQIAETCNTVRRKDLLLKTAHIQIG